MLSAMLRKRAHRRPKLAALIPELPEALDRHALASCREKELKLAKTCIYEND